VTQQQEPQQTLHTLDLVARHQMTIEQLERRIAELEAQQAQQPGQRPKLAPHIKGLRQQVQHTVARTRQFVTADVPRRARHLLKRGPKSSTDAVEGEATPPPETQPDTATPPAAPSTTATTTTERESTATETMHEEEAELAELPLMALMTGITLVSMVLGWVSEMFLPLPAVAWALYAIAYINGSFYSIQEAWDSLKQRQFDVNVLMIAAALGAALIGQPLEGAILMFLFSLSQTLKTYAMGRTYNSIRALLDMTPRTARVVRQPGGAEREEELPIEQVGVNEVVRVRPGEQIPADGVVVQGDSAVNEASITGESMPVEKQVSARVFAGTINGQGALDVRVTTAIEDSTISRIVKIVSQAREEKARSQHFTDRIIGQYYAYTVVALTLLAIFIPLVFLGWDLYPTIYRAITLMVGASPCALVISIPATLLSALASASWHGVLFKGGRHLESASRIQVVAFDKTGTLTTGKPGVVAVLPFEGAIPADAPRIAASTPGDLRPEQFWLLGMAAAVERFSEHPLAKAIVGSASEHGIALPTASDFASYSGSGVQATINGQVVQVGRPTLFAQVQQETLPPAAAEMIAEQERQGTTVILVGTPEQVWGALALADTLRPESANIVARLKQVGIRRVVLLTGDNHHVAEQLAAAVGIDEVRAELTPEQKIAAIRQIESSDGPVAMIGDGINDAPALATATLGVAMGAAGTDVAMESADVVLMSDDVSRLPGTLQLARRARRVVQQNLVFAFSVMLVLMGLAVSGLLPLTLATVAHEGSTLLVVANGLRLLSSWK
jgi:Zn2+/Cd2+-exporting ATPase